MSSYSLCLTQTHTHLCMFFLFYYSFPWYSFALILPDNRPIRCLWTNWICNWMCLSQHRYRAMQHKRTTRFGQSPYHLTVPKRSGNNWKAIPQHDYSSTTLIIRDMTWPWSFFINSVDWIFWAFRYVIPYRLWKPAQSCNVKISRCNHCCVFVVSQ